MPKEVLVYEGPMNTMIRRLKRFSVATLVASLALAPSYLAYVQARKRDKAAWQHYYLVAGMLGSSVLSTWLFHRVCHRYVFTVHALTAGPSIRLTTLDFWGRYHSQLVKDIKEITVLSDGTRSWLLPSTGQRFFVKDSPETIRSRTAQLIGSPAHQSMAS